MTKTTTNPINYDLVDSLGLNGVCALAQARTSHEMRDWAMDTPIVWYASTYHSGILGLRPHYDSVHACWKLCDRDGRYYFPAKGMMVVEGSARSAWICSDGGKEIYIQLADLEMIFRIFFEDRNRHVEEADAEFSGLLGHPKS